MDALSDRPTEVHQHYEAMVPVLRDRHLRFHEYDLVQPTSDVEELLGEIDRGPTAIFWG
jgi:hypothetical protein